MTMSKIEGGLVFLHKKVSLHEFVGPKYNSTTAFLVFFLGSFITITLNRNWNGDPVIGLYGRHVSGSFNQSG